MYLTTTYIRASNFTNGFSTFCVLRSRRIRPIVVDPSLYLSTRTDIVYATQKRDLPSAYRLFTGKSNIYTLKELHCISDL